VRASTRSGIVGTVEPGVVAGPPSDAIGAETVRRPVGAAAWAAAAASASASSFRARLRLTFGRSRSVRPRNGGCATTARIPHKGTHVTALRGGPATGSAGLSEMTTM
jgi:hypothetical protein